MAGSGTIGLTAVVAARQLGAGKIFVTARHKQQANMALALGADYACDPSNGDFERLILENTGRKYHKIVNDNGGGIHCFIDKQTGEVYKPASYNKPAKHVRYDMRIIEERNIMLSQADWAGSYLYLRG